MAGEYPDFGILSEESAPVSGASPYTWVVDPIDGTRNFAEGIPHFCVVVAIADGDQVVCGVTYDPVRDEMFSRPKGVHGASLNGQPITVSDRDDIDEAVLGFDLGYNFDQAKLLLELAAGVWPRVQGYRLMGSSALSLAYAACGRIDLYFHHSLSAWDIASGVLLAREAGGTGAGPGDAEGRHPVFAGPDRVQPGAGGAVPGADGRSRLAHDVNVTDLCRGYRHGCYRMGA